MSFVEDTEHIQSSAFRSVDDREIRRLTSDQGLGINVAYDDEFKAELVENLPHLRAFAHLIARNHALAEDLVQDTIVRALANRHQFKPGTNLKGWLIIILRNRFFNEMRRSSRKSEVSMDHQIDLAVVDGGQEIGVEIRDFNAAFKKLPPTQREALVLVGASGFSYEEAAEIAHCPIGTMKSRVSRARAELESQLHGLEMPEKWAGLGQKSEDDRPKRAVVPLGAGR